jgi:uncharacterized UPF0146 family protein
LPKNSPIIDVGGGESLLVDHLLALGYTDISVLDISAEALARSKERLGSKADEVKWIVADITQFKPKRAYALWHDRAVFHFLTEQKDIQYYVNTVRESVNEHLLLSTFSLDGPQKCSGLPITQYSVQSLTDIVSSSFDLVKFEEEVHTTPFKTTQAFLYCLFNRRAL